ncbi:hypothetical protein Ahy_B03g067469 isoform B [Arachis hypogaea]|uniref:Uncharacterized protein n=1 Tax=Arachis hypogaea TaxID=3818 RepID=A0A445A770_ARAHY|nr:hypothetical protein Ahy_B03g067469 isoform B [Arachis hypogaea]
MLKEIRHENDEFEKPNFLHKGMVTNTKAAVHCSSFSRSCQPLIDSPSSSSYDGSRARHTRYYGLVVQQLVIPPPLEARGDRCSPNAVPSSLGARTLEPTPRYHDPTFYLEWASQHGATTSPTKHSQSHVPSP